MVVIVSEVSKTSACRADTPRSREGLVQAHMSGVWGIAQSVEDRDFDAAAGLDRLLRDNFAIIQIGEPFASLLGEEIASCHGFAMRKLKRGNVDVANRKRAGHQPGLWNEVTSGPRPGMEGIGKYSLEMGHGFRARVNGK